MTDPRCALGGRLLVVASRLGAVAAAVSTGAGPAAAAPSVVSLDVTSGPAIGVTWRNPGPDYDSAAVQLSPAPDGAAAGPWVTYASAPVGAGVQAVSLDLRGIVADGRYAVRLLTRQGAFERAAVATRVAVIDTTPPAVSATFAPVAVEAFLPVSIEAEDRVSGLDLGRGGSFEVAAYDRDRKAPAGPWGTVGDVRAIGRGVGVDLGALPGGEYLGRVLVYDAAGLAGRSQPVWFSRRPGDPPVRPAPPERLVLRVRARRLPGRQRGRGNARVVLEGTLLGSAGRRLAGGQVAVRMPDGRCRRLRTGPGGVFRLSAPVARGGLIRIRVAAGGAVLERRLVIRPASARVAG